MIQIIQSILGIVVAINIILSTVIFSRGIKKMTDILFGLIALLTSLWSLAIIGFYSPSYQLITNWIIWTHLFAILVAYFFFIFSYHFPRKIARDFIIFPTTFIPLALVAYGLFFSNAIVSQTSDFSYQLGPWYPAYALVVIFYFFGGFAFLALEYGKNELDIEKKQILYVLFGSAVASSLALVTNLIFPYLNIFSYTWLGPIFTVIMVTSLFMAMLRYQLFSVKLIFTEIVSVLIIMALIVEIFYSQSVSEVILKTALLIILTIFSYLLVRSVYREIEQREKIESLAKQLESLVHLVSHEVKGALGKSRDVFGAILEGDLGEAPETMKHIVSSADEDTRKAVVMVMDILQSSDFKNGKMIMDKKPFDMKVAVEEVVATLAPDAQKKGIFIKTEIPDGVDYSVLGDREKIVDHVIRNLIDNSIKYTPSGGITVGLVGGSKNSGTRNGGAKTGTVLLSIKDTGVGITPLDMANLFTEGGHGKDSVKVNVHSTGYGLYFAKNIVEAHGGKIWAESDGAGKGSQFYVELKTA
jgi:signal transduction histidine kinase